MFRLVRNGLLVSCVLILSACSTYKLPEKALPVTLDPVFTDHMVLQRELPVRVWGKANPGEPVKVIFAGQTRRTVADTNGDWSVKLTPLKASTKAQSLIVKGHNEVVIQDVLVGEVWLCSGQSNMEWGLLGVPSGKPDAASADFPHLRLFSVDKVKAPTPQVKFKGTKGWVTCSPATLTQVGTHSGSFSATAFYFGRELQARLGIPVGLIQSAWGGSRIEPWTPSQGVATNEAGTMYNALISPLIPMTIRGAIWYQGESNRIDQGAYEAKMKKLIAAWRTVFERPDMPFYFVEIAPFNYKDNPAALGELRAAQARVAATMPNTGMIHTLDNPDNVGNIHPQNKRQTGERLARLALAKTYGVKVGKSIVGPSFAALQRDGAGVLVSFTETADAFVTVDGSAPTGFEAAATNGQWISATAEIRGDKIWVSLPDPTLSAIRFCWLHTQQTNLRNAEGFPPSPFTATAP